MYEEPKYVYYRNKRIPAWWTDYLPDEKNPYTNTDTLTLEPGCLTDYWHSHSSNKHPNFRGAEVCNFVQRMVYIHFGGAFLSGNYIWNCHQGQDSYHEPEHIFYENAYIGEDKNIHIKDANKYYEDVIRFVQLVLRETSKNHYPAPSGGYGIENNARGFFPHATDAQIEKARINHEQCRLRTAEYRKKLFEYINSDAFSINEITFEKDEKEFHADFTPDDDWINTYFNFGKVTTNHDKEKGLVQLIIRMPDLFRANFEKKDLSKATKTLEIPFCFYIYISPKDAYRIHMPVPKEKVSESVILQIEAACNEAMANYNKAHMDMIVNTSQPSVQRYYPHNIFLDNEIGHLKLVYENTWAISKLAERC